MHPRNSIIQHCTAIEFHHCVVKYKIYIVKQFIEKKNENLCTTTKHIFLLLIAVTIVTPLIIFCVLLFNSIQFFMINFWILNRKYEIIDVYLENL